MRIRFSSAAAARPRASSNSSDLVIMAPPLGTHTEEEAIAAPVSGRHDHGRLTLYEIGDFRAARISISLSEESPSEAAHLAYGDLLGSLEGDFLYRIWNYVPSINEGEGDEERYRQFCLGRSKAFEERYGTRDIQYMPAGSCVGCEGETLEIIALLGQVRPEHHENPHQLPAYRYPREYGPRSPSFARASSVTMGDRRYRFLSGTSAVIGHESVGIGDLQEQLRVTCNNLETIANETLQAYAPGCRGQILLPPSGKVYLRQAEHYEIAKAYLESRLSEWATDLVYLRADLCRRELLVEIELAFTDQL